jgi:hypothetical protein
MQTVRIPDGRTFELPWLHFGVMGEPGSGKSELCSTLPKPLKVIATDPITKMQPYFDKGILDPVATTGPFGQVIRLVRHRETGEVIIEVEGFYDTDPTMTSAAMTGVTGRMSVLVQEVKAGKWKSVALDSWSGLEDCASDRRRMGPMKCANPDGRAHRNEAKDDCKQIFRMQLIHLPCNVGITFHTTKFQMDQGGETLYNMKCIGDFATTVGQNLAERYHSVAQPDGITRVLYTKPDGRFKLATLIDAPSPCANNFAALVDPMLRKLIAADDAKKASATKA